MPELERLSVEAYKNQERQPIVLVLDNIRSGLNVGSIFRTADAFNIEKIICCGITPVPPNREVLKSALGSTETVIWEEESSILEVIQKLRMAGIACFAIEQTEDSLWLHEFKRTADKRYAFILGNEVDGVNQAAIHICDGALEIEQFGTKHSLNVAVCAGILLNSLRFK